MVSGRQSIERFLEEHSRKTGSTATAPITGADAEPLEAIAIHRHPAGHFHFITLGLSELSEKVSADATRSGWGFELTMRAAGTDDPPGWPVRALRQLSEYVLETRNPFAEGHFVDLGGPIDEAATAITALAITRDPELRGMTTSTGPLEFLQVVGLHADEAVLAARWSVLEVVGALGEIDPDLIACPERASLLADPAIAAEFQRRADADGAGAVTAIASSLAWSMRGWLRSSINVSIGPRSVARRNLRVMLPELRRGRAVRVMSEGRVLAFRLASRAGWKGRPERVDVAVTPQVLAQLVAFLDGNDAEFGTPDLRGLTLHFVD